MKGYRLEDLESRGGKVIASRDVKFMEDKSPSDLTVVDICGMTATAKETMDLMNLFGCRKIDHFQPGRFKCS